MNTQTSPHVHSIEVYNRLLRGELSAVEAYNRAIAKFSYERNVDRLMDIREDHVLAAKRLSTEIGRLGGLPTSDSGAWGTFVQAIQGTANLFGENSAIHTLQRGERHGINEYLEVLEDEEIPEESKELIRAELLPKASEHLDVLESVED